MSLDVDLIRRAIADPGRYTKRTLDESVASWSARAVVLAVEQGEATSSSEPAWGPFARYLRGESS